MEPDEIIWTLDGKDFYRGKTRNSERGLFNVSRDTSFADCYNVWSLCTSLPLKEARITVHSPEEGKELAKTVLKNFVLSLVKLL